MDVHRTPLVVLALLTCFLALHDLPRAQAATKKDVYSLHDNLFTTRGYKKQVRPIEFSSNSLFVYMAFSLLSLVDVNEKDQNLVSNARMRLSWSDYLLSWLPANYGNITSLLVRQEDIWLPDIQVANSVVKQQHFGYDELPVRLLSGGDIVWSPTTVLSTACDIDVTYYPMDTQVCYIIFETSMSTNDEIDINIDTRTPISLVDYSEDGQWQIVDTSSENLSDEDSKTKIRFGLVLKRRRAYYVVNIIMPYRYVCRSICNITVLLFYAVYLTIVSDHLPNTSVQTSILAVYLTTLLGITAVSTVVSVFILKLHHRSPGQRVGPRIQKLVVFLKRITLTLNEDEEHLSKNTVSPSNDGESVSHYRASPLGLSKHDLREERDTTQNDHDQDHLDVPGRRRSRAATLSHVVMDRRLSSPPVYHSPMTWQDVAQTIDWFLFLVSTVMSLMLTIIIMAILTVGADNNAPSLSLQHPPSE
ncbi:neuronal acetylcholine receptor subunit alpha-2 [Elysia marginata]|uniref:Neuronal acetylcholine receptor subunit alpha-2 n=1 Tax=Elysia marginata TaxID=1093978 RepID=A0AAV4J863_9GAST|nr:neuronal acetylcholine receptor subunit alpha-2 [Elysia marginata]